MDRSHIAVVTVADDLHALAIREAFKDRPDIVFSIVEASALAGGDSLSWSDTDTDEDTCTLPTRDGGSLDVRDLDLIWWRRINTPQRLPADVTDPDHIDVINNDCTAALLGSLLTRFGGVWINHPVATRTAENKLVQLRAAQAAGFRIPRTLVSQGPARIRRFCTELDGRVIIKPVRGSNAVHLLTQPVSPELLADAASLRLSPAIYQECIPGTRHIRAHCFGDAVYSVLIESAELDWRGNLDIPFRPYALPTRVTERLRDVLAALDLTMGIVDLKLTDAGEPVWLEVNPQGQFLFCEGLSGLDLTTAFVTFLVRQLAR